MGFFSFLTADTEESIANIHCDEHDGREVFLLQPDGKPPIGEAEYDGYGVFGDVDAYAWLARINRPDLTKGLADADVRTIGVQLRYGCQRDVHTGELFSFMGRYPDSTAHGMFDEAIERYGKTPNDLLEDGTWEKYFPALEYPLKFSFNKEAVYEDLPASKDCPDQGFFYNF